MSTEQPLSPLQQLLDRDGASADVLCVGDSVLGRVADEDVDRRPLGQMVADALAPRSSAWSWFVAYHVDSYLALVRAVLDAGWRPSTIVVPINVRGFSPQWFGNPAWDYSSHHAALRGFSGAPVPVVEHEPSADELLAHRARALGSPFLPGWTVGDAEDARDDRDANRDDRWRTMFAFHLGVPIVPDHPRLTQLRELERICSAADVELLVYVTPINVEGARRHLGGALVDLIRANVRSLGPVLDLSELLPATSFFYEADPTEHLNERGRRELAATIAAQVTPAAGARRRRR
ncbi:MAG: hypothetical protein V7636_2932 [Actinomycetota bacterium]